MCRCTNPPASYPAGGFSLLFFVFIQKLQIRFLYGFFQSDVFTDWQCFQACVNTLVYHKVAVYRFSLFKLFRFLNVSSRLYQVVRVAEFVNVSGFILSDCLDFHCRNLSYIRKPTKIIYLCWHGLIYILSMKGTEFIIMFLSIPMLLIQMQLLVE